MTVIIICLATLGIFWIGQGIYLCLWAIFEIVRQALENNDD